MRGKGIVWFMWISGVSCAVWFTALGWTLLHHFGYLSGAAPVQTAAAVTSVEVTPAPKTANDGKLHLVSLGDSLARGTGDTGGKGYVGVLADQLKQRAGSQEVNVSNLGVNGFTSSQLAEQIKRPDIQETIRQADVVLLSIGGNDLFRGGETLALLESDQIGKLQKDYNDRLKSLLFEIRGLNAAANVYLIGLYNPFNGLKDSEATNRIVRDWNYQLSVTAAGVSKVVVVPTYDLFQLKVQDYLASDQFHPNAEGYKRIGDRLAAIVAWEG